MRIAPSPYPIKKAVFQKKWKYLEWVVIIIKKALLTHDFTNNSDHIEINAARVKIL